MTRTENDSFRWLNKLISSAWTGYNQFGTIMQLVMIS